MYKPIPLPTQLEVAYFHGKNCTQRGIAEITDISKSSVNRIISIIGKREERDQKVDFKTQLKYHFVLYKVMTNPFITNKQISNLSKDFEFKMSESSVGRIILNLNIKNKFQKPKEMLTSLQKENRVLFSKNLLKSELYLLPMTFSDESMVCLEPFKKKKIKILPILDNDDYFCEKQGYPIKIMIWGCIALNYKSPIIWVKKKLNSNEYIKLLCDNLIFEDLNKRFGNFSYIFQQDGASSHRAKNTLNFLNTKVKIYKDDLKWPANSPDLNVIEMLWAIIKARINVDEISNQEQLFNEIKKIWEDIPISTINLLIQSFDSRLKTCIQLKGESLNGKKKV